MRYQVPLRGDKEIKKNIYISVQLVRQTNNYKGGRVCLIDLKRLLPFTVAKTYISAGQNLSASYLWGSNHS